MYEVVAYCCELFGCVDWHWAQGEVGLELHPEGVPVSDPEVVVGGGCNAALWDGDVSGY